MADTGTAPAPMTAEEERTKQVAIRLLRNINGLSLPSKVGTVAAVIRAAETEAEQRGKAAGLTMTQKRLSDDLADAMEALADLHENIVGEPVPCRSTPGGQPESPPSASELRDAILSAHCKPDADADQRGAERACEEMARFLEEQAVWIRADHRAKLAASIRAMVARAKQQEPA